MSVLVITFSGHLGQDPDLRFAKNEKGTAYATCGCAVKQWNRSKREEETIWLELIAFGGTAEQLHKRAQKGSGVVISGTLKQERSDDERYDKRLSVVVESFDVVSNWVKQEGRGDAVRSGDADDRRSSDGERGRDRARDSRGDHRDVRETRSDRGGDGYSGEYSGDYEGGDGRQRR